MEFRTQKIKRELRIKGARLQIKDREGSREIWLSKSQYVVGSSPLCDIVINDPTVSRRHFEIIWEPDKMLYRIRDLGSTNGTEVNGVLVSDAYIQGSCVIKIGNTKIDFVLTDIEHKIDLWPEDDFFGMKGRSIRMREIFSTAFKVAQTDLSVLVEGETGVGKEELARAIHEASRRAKYPFVVCDLTTIPRDLFLSELFGYEKGAFTGATESKKGIVFEADGGTLFLDEIAEIPEDVQPHLLRFADRREARRVGATEFQKLDIRIISATARDVDKLIEEGKFRQDLFFRLAQFRIKIPPLRERPEDIPFLIEHFVNQLAGDEGEKKKFLEEIFERIDMLRAYPWPGNVRELKNFVERAWAFWKVSGKVKIDFFEGKKVSIPDISSLLHMKFKDAKRILIESFEREYVSRVWEISGHNVTRSAEIAGVNRKYMEKLVKKYIKGEDVSDLNEGEEEGKGEE